MGHSCRLYKTCFVCRRSRHNLDFHSNASGRIDVKPYCKYCKSVYEGLQQGLIQEKDYIGKNFDWSLVDDTKIGYILLLHHNRKQATLVSKKEAKRWVQQGGACVISSHEIEMISPNHLSRDKLKEYVLRRDKQTCFYCKERGNTIDHVIPRSKGGLDTTLNWVCACYDCNQIKANMQPDEFLRNIRNGTLNLEKEKQIRKNKRYEKMKDIKRKHHRPTLNLPKPLAKEQKKQSKTCSLCYNKKDYMHFSNAKAVCRTCEPFQKAFQKKYISHKTLSELNVKTELLSNSFILVEDKEGYMVNQIPLSNARLAVKQHIATILNSGKIRLLFHRSEMADLGYHQKALKAI